MQRKDKLISLPLPLWEKLRSQAAAAQQNLHRHIITYLEMQAALVEAQGQGPTVETETAAYAAMLDAWIREQGLHEVTWQLIARDCLQLSSAQWADRSLQMRVGEALRLLDWVPIERRRPRLQGDGSMMMRVWVPVTVRDAAYSA